MYIFLQNFAFTCTFFCIFQAASCTFFWKIPVPIAFSPRSFLVAPQKVLHNESPFPSRGRGVRFPLFVLLCKNPLRLCLPAALREFFPPAFLPLSFRRRGRSRALPLGSRRFSLRCKNFYAMEVIFAIFPHHGSKFRKNFHTMEAIFGRFPHHGSPFSTLWKTHFASRGAAEPRRKIPLR